MSQVCVVGAVQGDSREEIVISLCWAKRETAVRKGWFCVRICNG
jgi:hypothetical protein